MGLSHNPLFAEWLMRQMYEEVSFPPNYLKLRLRFRAMGADEQIALWRLRSHGLVLWDSDVSIPLPALSDDGLVYVEKYLLS